MNLASQFINLLLTTILGSTVYGFSIPLQYTVALLECSVDPTYLIHKEISLGANSKFTVLPLPSKWDPVYNGIEITHIINYDGIINGYIGKNQTTIYYRDNLFYSVLDDLCMEDMQYMIPILEEYYLLWLDSQYYYSNSTYFLAKFKTIEFEKQLLESEKKWLECHYFRYQHSRDWILAVDEIRDYCFTDKTYQKELSSVNPNKLINYIFDQPLLDIIYFVLSYLGIIIFMLISFIAIFKMKKVKIVGVASLFIFIVSYPIILFFSYWLDTNLTPFIFNFNFYSYWIIVVLLYIKHLNIFRNYGQIKPRSMN